MSEDVVLRLRIVLLAMLVARPALAVEPLLVLELFTSSSCPACGAADKVIAEMAQSDPDVLALDLHVTYLDRPNARDPDSLPEATQRHQDYTHRLGSRAYLPQVVAGGSEHAVGADAAGVRAAMARARRAAVPVSLEADGPNLRAQVGMASGHGRLVLVGFDPQAGLARVNVVRAAVPVGSWSGAPMRLALARPPGTRAALLLQAEDGHILGAAALP